MYLKETVYEGRQWIKLAQNRVQWQSVVPSAMNFQVPWKTGKFLNS